MKRKRNKYASHKTFMQKHIVQQTNTSFDIVSANMLIFEIQGIAWDLSMMSIIYKLTKRTTKTENFEKFLKMCILLNFMTIRYKMIASNQIIHSILHYKLMILVRILRLHKE